MPENPLFRHRSLSYKCTAPHDVSQWLARGGYAQFRLPAFSKMEIFAMSLKRDSYLRSGKNCLRCSKKVRVTHALREKHTKRVNPRLNARDGVKCDLQPLCGEG